MCVSKTSNTWRVSATLTSMVMVVLLFISANVNACSSGGLNINSDTRVQPADKTAQTIVPVTYIRLEEPVSAGTPDYLKPPSDNGYAGAIVAVKDANITGKFLGYQFEVSEIKANTLRELGNVLEDQHKRHSANQANNTAPVILLDVKSSQLLAVVDLIQNSLPAAIFFNVANSDDELRLTTCQLPLIHTAVSYQMKADALAQWFRSKRMQHVLAIYGKTPDDQAYLTAFTRSARKFKLTIVESKQWQDSFDLRRAAFSEIFQFTRTSKRYEAVFTADSAAQFAYSLPFNTYLQVPVVGAAGLKALGWHFTHEQWGARQLQNRFYHSVNRHMNEVDYASYVAVTSVASAAQHGSQLNHDALWDTLLSDNFSLAAYKGRSLSIRRSTHQLRQPVTLAHEDALVTHAPLPGFLHQSNELDTLGTINATCKEVL